MPSGSLAVTETATGWFGFGTAGACARLEKVGPIFGTKRELMAPGVPLWIGTARSNVRARRLKYRRMFNLLLPANHRARQDISYSRPSTMAALSARIASIWF